MGKGPKAQASSARGNAPGWAGGGTGGEHKTFPPPTREGASPSPTLGGARGAPYAPTSSTGAPNTSIRGLTPRPGSIEAVILPFCLCGAPSAVLTVT